MCLLVMTVALISVVGEVSTMAMVEEVVTAAAEEADDEWGSWRLCSVIYFSSFFLNVTATASEGQGKCAVPSPKAHPSSVILVTVIDALWSAWASALLSLLSPLM
jgi:hypothetical protein